MTIERVKKTCIIFNFMAQQPHEGLLTSIHMWKDRNVGQHVVSTIFFTRCSSSWLELLKLLRLSWPLLILIKLSSLDDHIYKIHSVLIIDFHFPTFCYHLWTAFSRVSSLVTACTWLIKCFGLTLHYIGVPMRIDVLRFVHVFICVMMQSQNFLTTEMKVKKSCLYNKESVSYI